MSRTLLSIALTAIAQSIPREILERTAQLRPLLDLSTQSDSAGTWRSHLANAAANPNPEDARIFALAAGLGLSGIEILTVALAAAVERDIEMAQLVAILQQPMAGARPTIGLITRAMGEADQGGSAFASLVSGPALKSGLLVLSDAQVPHPERTVRVPLPLVLALCEKTCDWPGSSIGLAEQETIPLCRSQEQELRRQARALLDSGERRLVLRAGSSTEARCAAGIFADELKLTPIFLASAADPGLSAWLYLHPLLPVHAISLGPGERRPFPDIPAWDGPALALIGPDGELDSPAGLVLSTKLETPAQSERESLWLPHVRDPDVARELAAHYRLRSGRIADLARLGRRHAALDNRVDLLPEDVYTAARSGEATGLSSLAELVTCEIPDDALIVLPALRRELELLCFRCEARETLADDLGISIRSRYRPGVLALLFGPSGTGKTLAALWLATRLGLPLYRVDLAAVTSKYVGETERNLSHLLTCAEQAGVILLFDEADSMFGRRTEVRDSNDRFANAQTNYLLQRMENFDGIAVLTSNSRSRLDASFSRRLETILEFPLPDPGQRRALWQSHLGLKHSLTDTEINHLALSADLTGGDIRNAALAAAIYARTRKSPIGLADVLGALGAEYRKLGRHLPDALSRSAAI